MTPLTTKCGNKTTMAISKKYGFSMEIEKFLKPEGHSSIEHMYYDFLDRHDWLTPALPGCFNFKFSISA